MKKVMSFIGCALFVAAMTVSCAQKNAEEATEPETENTEAVATEATSIETAASTCNEADHQAMMTAAQEAGMAKCNCYKTDAASVEACIKSILSEKYAQYQDNEEFKAEMDATYQNCLKEKVSDAAKDATQKGISAAAEGISNALKK